MNNSLGTEALSPLAHKKLNPFTVEPSDDCSPDNTLIDLEVGMNRSCRCQTLPERMCVRKPYKIIIRVDNIGPSLPDFGICN